MRMGRKILYYLLGVGLGIVMVYFFFGDRDIQCSYFPNDRVLYDLRKKEIVLSTEQLAQDSSGLSYALERARVDFSRSDIGERECNVYFLDFEESLKTFVLENCDSTAYLLRVEALPQD